MPIQSQIDFIKTIQICNQEAMSDIKKKLKIRKGQIERVFEIAMMCVVDLEGNPQMKDVFGAWLKKRIEVQNKDTIISKIKHKYIEIDGELQDIPIDEFQRNLPQLLLKIDELYDFIVREEYTDVVRKITKFLK